MSSYLETSLPFIHSPRVVHSAEIVAEALHPELAGLWGHTGATLLTLTQALDPKTFTLPPHAQSVGACIDGGDGGGGTTTCC